MPFQFRLTYIHIFTATVIFAVYGWWVFGFLGIEYFTGPDALTRIGKAIAALIVFGYAFEISVVVFTTYLKAKLSNHTKEELKEEFIVDERDFGILYKSIYGSHLVLCTGLFLAMGALALGWSAFWVFNIIVFAFLLSVVTELSTKLFLYRKSA